MPEEQTPTRHAYLVIVEIDENGGNAFHAVTAESHAVWRADPHGPDMIDFVRDRAEEFDEWRDAVTHIASMGGEVTNVIAFEGDRDEV